MKVKTVRGQLIEIGLKHGDRINVKGIQQNPFTIDFRYNCLRTGNDEYKLEYLADYEFEKVVPTKEELIEELKKRSKKFEYGKYNNVFYYSDGSGKVSWITVTKNRHLNGIYFTDEEAENICKELNADREKVKILFDLEE